MSYKTIIDINISADENFNRLLDAVKSALNEAIFPFQCVYTCRTQEEFMQYLRYDYNSLYTLCVYNLLNLLSITYAEEMPKCKAAERMPVLYTEYCSDEEMNRKRVKRIKDEYLNRNEEHSVYLHSPAYTPKILATDSQWYYLLSEFSALKRFLHKEEPKITKKFLDDLNLVYDRINTYTGYDRFYLSYKLEMSSKLEMFYKILSLVKKEKRRLKLSDAHVKQMIDKMNNMHVVKYNYSEFSYLLETFNNPVVFNEIQGFNYEQKTVNAIVFNVDDLIKLYVENSAYAIYFINVLNYIHNAVVFHLCIQIENELSLSDCKKGFELINDIQHCKTASVFFEKYLDSNEYINFEKNCSKDITFQHFKRIFKLK